MKTLDDSQKEKLRIELITDYNAPDYHPITETRRIQTLERDIVLQYGFEGIKLVFEEQNSSHYHPLGQFPKNCPWFSWNDKTLQEFVATNFGAISQKIPRLLFTLKEQCTFLYCEEDEGQWYLHYLFTQVPDRFGSGEYIVVYTGGAPLADPKPNSSLVSHDWQIPDDLAEFYAIHNGFGMEETYCILPNEKLEVLADTMGEEESDDVFDFLSAHLPAIEPAEEKAKEDKGLYKELLKFYPDNAGNAQCFYKRGRNTTVRWWHDDDNTLDEVGFFEFIDEAMSALDDPF
ncbi:MAG: SMI1/KNR4 family protein [Bacteroidota bacterium]